MKDQVHIRNAEAAHLARTLAKQTGKTINEVILDALRSYRPGRAAASSRRQAMRWRHLLAKDRSALNTGAEVPIESLYNEKSGLPE